MTGKAEKELLHKLALYSQMIDLYPSEPKYLRRYIELLLQLDRESEALEKLRLLERLYEKGGSKKEALSIKQLRQSLDSSGSDFTQTISPVLSSVNPAALSMLMRNAKRIRLKEGDYLIRQNDTDENMYIVISGELAVMVLYPKRSAPTLIHLLGEGEIVGEMAFLEGGARCASVVANSTATVLELSQKRVLQCLLKYPETGEMLRAESQCRRRLTIINGNRILERLPVEEKRHLAQESSIRKYESFKVVRRSGATQNWVGIMETGLIRIVAEDRNGKSHILEPIKPGDMIGEIAAVRDEAVPADMVTVTDTIILQIPMKVFQKAMANNPRVKNKLMDSAADRMASTMIRIRKQAKQSV
ncbi:MAG TPA: cyclic nucleotide-binding domain-containing protein [Mariprofundaceae bacterium]|nr:cyclic nucleotide-binding domain-containing protein [Mariprofundaceae bacterium]